MKKITLNEYITASGRYPDRLNSSELTKSVKTNATTLLEKVNALLLDLGVSGPFSVSSGFRPSAVNGATPNAAKGSLHQSGQAIDMHGLWLEHPNNTIGKNTNWCHLDMDSTIRKDRPVRVFIPA